jgi:DNA-binding NarL/FixJ family response regulator
MRVNKIRVLLANHPLMIPDGIRELVAQEEDMEIVGDLRGPMKILQETGRTMADAVILAQEGMDEPGLCSQLLAVYPDLTILSIAPNMTSGFMQQLCSRRRDLASVEHLDIAQTLRMAVRDPCGRPREV